MPVKYLSPEWVDAYNAALASDESLRTALAGKNATIQMVIADGPHGEVHYWLRIADGTASARLGDAEEAEVTISQSYETSARLDQGELDGWQAFLQGKFKVRGKMHKMMQLGRPLAQIQKALAALEIEY